MIEVSRAVGAEADYVQGGGGNTSVKSADGRTMLVKASGTTLADMSEEYGWVETDLAVVLAMLDAGLDALAPAERERRVLEELNRSRTGGPGGRASVETVLHAQLGRVVIHTHPPAVNALTCGPGREALQKLAVSGKLPPLWVPFAAGFMLARAVREAVAAYRREHGAAPQVFFLENHGIFVSADGASDCLRIHDEWVERCEEFFAGAPQPAPGRETSSAELRAVMASLRGKLADRTGKPSFLRMSADDELVSAACSPAADVLATGALTPDQIVYCGSRFRTFDSLEELASAADGLPVDAGAPRVLLVRGVGALLRAEAPDKLDVVESVAACAARSVRMASARGGARNLPDEANRFVVGWEAEHYRAGLSPRSAGDLAGRVALVTGAASGLGCGIAQGLVKAGAAVAFCDIDLEGSDRAAGEAGLPRGLAVHMDVTDEASVAAACDRILRHWGGIDVAVCAAGVAPPYDLVDMPVQKWRTALDVNLTGYFLVARECARIMKGQNKGGAMVMLSSKTGLEASKSNSAYNATKAGELHLARGWAMELGRDGIRINAVAPGNVFEGSKIWNPEYIRKCAAKKGIRPEEVIPYYNSLTALGREIRRQDVADAVVFLCSDRARCITGQVLVVDSGQVMAR
jgi:NAD(P)-dependent dehydrogenase (short-subunit alcohol dehydrogenase family)/rhamnose utilization protein RhaD (predicted bifunctional aldolase and dehydrogenase)